MRNLSLSFLFVSSIFVYSCNNTATENSAKTDQIKDSSATMKKKNEQVMPQDSVAAMKAWEDYMTPSAMHKLLQSYDGIWEGVITLWMNPGAPPIVNKGMCISRMVLGGRYQISENKGEFNGMPFEGTSTVAFDNARKVFLSTWIDNMGTGIMYLEGTFDEKTRTITYKGKSVDPVSGKELPTRELFRLIDNNHQTQEMYITQNGVEFESMEVKYTRKMK